MQEMRYCLRCRKLQPVTAQKKTMSRQDQQKPVVIVIYYCAVCKVFIKNEMKV